MPNPNPKSKPATKSKLIKVAKSLKRTASKNQPLKRWQSYGLLLVNVICWGAALPIVKPAFNHTTPFRYLFYRFVIASFLTIPLMWRFAQQHEITFKRIKTIVLLELFGSVLGYAILYTGLSMTTSLEASLIVTASPIFTVLAGMLYLHEREEAHEWIGLLLAFAGTIMITIAPVLMGKTAFSFMSFTGNAMIVVQNITSAIYFVLAKKHYDEYPKLLVSGISYLLCMFSFGLLSIWQLGFNSSQFALTITQDLSHPSVWFAALYMAIVGSIIAGTAYLKGQESIEASEACLFGYLSPLVYFPMSILFLHEKFTFYDAVGLAIVIFGVAFAELRIRRHRAGKHHLAHRSAKLKAALS